MVWNCVDPLVQSGIQFGDNVLLPARPDEAQKDLRFINRILTNIITMISAQRNVT